MVRNLCMTDPAFTYNLGPRSSLFHKLGGFRRLHIVLSMWTLCLTALIVCLRNAVYIQGNTAALSRQKIYLLTYTPGPNSPY